MGLKTLSPSTLEKTQATLEQLFSWLANDMGPEVLQSVSVQVVETQAGDNQDTTNTTSH